MVNNRSSHYRLRVVLEDCKPKVWREVIVPARLTLAQLHEVLQITMGWYNCHLHTFTVSGKMYSGMPDLEEVALADQINLVTAFQESPKGFEYCYDIGDNWIHLVTLVKQHRSDDEDMPPICIGGEGACPPENVGGVHGYSDFLAAIKNPKSKDHKEMLEWVGGSFDPASFNPRQVTSALILWWQKL